jgi:hypothetical protein
VYVAQAHDFWVSSDSESNVSEFFVNSHETALLLRKGSSREDGLKVDPLSLDQVQFGEVVIDSAELLFDLPDLVSKASIEP